MTRCRNTITTTAVMACDPHQADDPVPWINLDETDQINLDNMYAGHVLSSSSPGNSAPQLIRFLAKANRAEYAYVTGNSSPIDAADQWWVNVPAQSVSATKDFLAQNQASPPAGSSTLVSLPFGTIEIKAGWRPLNPSELASGHFHTQTVRFYEQASSGSTAACYRDAVWGLVALHIIQKTPSAPYFIYATFEQADNIKTAAGVPIEDVDGNIVVPPTAPPTTPQECLVDPRPPVGPPNNAASSLGSVILTANPATCQPLAVQQYCAAPGSRLYYHNAPSVQPVPSGGNICVNSRINQIPSYVITANQNAHAAIAAYLKTKSISSAPWLYYKLVNVSISPTTRSSRSRDPERIALHEQTAVHRAESRGLQLLPGQHPGRDQSLVAAVQRRPVAAAGGRGRHGLGRRRHPAQEHQLWRPFLCHGRVHGLSWQPRGRTGPARPATSA